jgi:hypothetical protein
LSRLIAVILLSVLMFPLAGVIYLLTFFTIVAINSFRREETGLVVGGIVTCIFIAVYWLTLWRKTVQWTPPRQTLTAVSGAVAVLVGLVIGFLMSAAINEDDIEFIVFIASLISPLLWVFATILIWRETAAERAARLSQTASGIVCPTCGYNLTGLTGTRCPECGTQFTLDQLVANQPKREQVEIER